MISDGCCIVPVRAQAVGDVLDDPPIGPASLQRLKHLVEPLNAPLGAGECSFLFQARRGGQDDIGEPAGLAEENVLHDEKLELAEGVLDIVGVGVDQAHFLAEQIHRLELALLDRVDHLVVIEALGGRQLHAPGRFEARAHFGIVDRLIAGQQLPACAPWSLAPCTLLWPRSG